jgi:hypothetical protein
MVFLGGSTGYSMGYAVMGKGFMKASLRASMESQLVTRWISSLVLVPMLPQSLYIQVSSTILVPAYVKRKI